jgi:hypothetical protein
MEWPGLQAEGKVTFEGQVQALYSIVGRRVARAVELGGPIQVQARADGGVDLRNATALHLRGAYLFLPGRRRDVGEIAPGANVRVDATGWQAVPVAENWTPHPATGGDFAAAARSLAEAVPNLYVAGRSAPGWLVAEVADFDPMLRVEGIPSTNRLTLLAVRLAKAGR